MEALVRGSRAPRVQAVCQECGSSFERSAVHPYIVRCPTCRGSRAVAAPVAAVPVAEAEARLAAACRGLNEASSGSDDQWLAARAELAAASLVRANAGT